MSRKHSWYREHAIRRLSSHDGGNMMGDESFAPLHDMPGRVYLLEEEYMSEFEGLYTYWWLKSSPMNSKAAVQNPHAWNPFFMPDSLGTYTFGLAVSRAPMFNFSDPTQDLDDPMFQGRLCGVQWYTIAIEVHCNMPPHPMLQASPPVSLWVYDEDTEAMAFEPISLNASAGMAVDPDTPDEALWYTWDLVGWPKSSTSRNVWTATHTRGGYFQPDVVGEYRLRVRATDGCSVGHDSVTVSAQCRDPPIASLKVTPGEWSNESGRYYVTARERQTENLCKLPLQSQLLSVADFLHVVFPNDDHLVLMS